MDIPNSVKYILHITDCHLFADANTKLLDFNTRDSFVAVMNLVKSLNPSFIAFTGDLSQDESLQAYSYISKTINNYFSCPLSFIPGNHDNLQLMQQAFGRNNKVFVLGDYVLIFLNSQDVGNVPGLISNEELTFLDKCLDNNSDKKVIVFLHHHIFKVGSAWLDNLNVQNGNDFIHILTKYNNVKMVVNGHVHQESCFIYSGIMFVSTPSTCFQFKPMSNDFALDTVMPGFRLIFLDDHISTKVVRVGYNSKFVPDLQSKGYK